MRNSNKTVSVQTHMKTSRGIDHAVQKNKPIAANQAGDKQSRPITLRKVTKAEAPSKKNDT